MTLAAAEAFDRSCYQRITHRTIRAERLKKFYSCSLLCGLKEILATRSLKVAYFFTPFLCLGTAITLMRNRRNLFFFTVKRSNMWCDSFCGVYLQSEKKISECGLVIEHRRTKTRNQKTQQVIEKNERSEWFANIYINFWMDWTYSANCAVRMPSGKIFY